MGINIQLLNRGNSSICGRLLWEGENFSGWWGTCLSHSALQWEPFFRKCRRLWVVSSSSITELLDKGSHSFSHQDLLTRELDQAPGLIDWHQQHRCSGEQTDILAGTASHPRCLPYYHWGCLLRLSWIHSLDFRLLSWNVLLFPL